MVRPERHVKFIDMPCGKNAVLLMSNKMVGLWFKGLVISIILKLIFFR
jgi:hypothetical protein